MVRVNFFSFNISSQHLHCHSISKKKFKPWFALFVYKSTYLCSIYLKSHLSWLLFNVVFSSIWQVTWNKKVASWSDAKNFKNQKKIINSCRLFNTSVHICFLLIIHIYALLKHILSMIMQIFAHTHYHTRDLLLIRSNLIWKMNLICSSFKRLKFVYIVLIS